MSKKHQDLIDALKERLAQAKPQQEGATVLADAKPSVKEPVRYKVLLHNDDYTTTEFVVEVLVTYFEKSAAQAQDIMMKVHYEGRGIAGIYPYEVAEMKVAQVTDLARGRGHPLKLTMEPNL